MSKKPTCEALSERIKVLEQTCLAQQKEVELLNAIRKDVLQQENEEKYRLIVENQNELIVKFDPQERILYASPSYCTTFGVEEKEIVGKCFFPFIHEDDRENVKISLKILKKPPHSTYHEERAKTVTGWRWFGWSLKGISNDGEDITEFVAVGRDISTRKRAEALLSESQERYRSIFINAPLGIFRSTLEGRFLEVNPSLAKMLGYESPDEVIKSIHSIGEQIYVRSEKREQIVSEQLHSSDFTQHLNHYRRKDGSEFIANLYLKTIHDQEGKPAFLEGIVEDITDRRKFEEKLEESQKKFKTIADFTYDWEYWIGADGRCIYISPSCERITGYGPEEFFNNPELMEEIVHPEDRTMVMEHRQQTHNLEEPHLVDFRIITRNGEEKWIGHLCRSVYDEKGRFLGKRGSNRDITQRKRLQAESVKAQKMEAIATLAGGIAHQFNNALSVITGNLELLEYDAFGDETVVNYAGRMKAASDRMAKLTSQLLAYARGGKYQAATTSLEDFVAETLPILRHAVGSGITIHTHFPQNDLFVHIDQTQMQMTLSAVLANASEAMDGEGEIGISLEKVHIGQNGSAESADLEPRDYACLKVMDTGKGMDAETRSRIFEPFFTTKFQGRGLGLAAAFGIVKNHNGAITVASEVGKGTTVSIYLPLTITSEVRKEEPAQTDEWPEGKGTVLVIDDEEVVMSLCRTMLERLGYDVLEAKTGAEALTIAQTYGGNIDVALLDVVIPDMQGEALYPMLKKFRPLMKVIVNSGYSLDGPARNILNAGADAFIQKPFRIADLSRKIKELLDPIP